MVCTLIISLILRWGTVQYSNFQFTVRPSSHETELCYLPPSVTFETGNCSVGKLYPRENWYLTYWDEAVLPPRSMYFIDIAIPLHVDVLRLLWLEWAASNWCVQWFDHMVNQRQIEYCSRIPTLCTHKVGFDEKCTKLAITRNHMMSGTAPYDRPNGRIKVIQWRVVECHSYNDFPLYFDIRRGHFLITWPLSPFAALYLGEAVKISGNLLLCCGLIWGTCRPITVLCLVM